MTGGEKILIGVWLFLPIVFLLLALWARLEQVGGKTQQDHPIDYVRQATFLAVCGIITALINHFFIDWIVSVIPFGLTKGLAQFLLYPCVLAIGAQLWGPTADVLISKSRTSPGRKR